MFSVNIHILTFLLSFKLLPVSGLERGLPLLEGVSIFLSSSLPSLLSLLLSVVLSTTSVTMFSSSGLKGSTKQTAESHQNCLHLFPQPDILKQADWFIYLNKNPGH
jgi:hypothetical protein